MADTISSSQSAIFKFQFLDGDDRQFKLDNARDNITAAEVDDLGNYIAANNFLVGDRNNSPISLTEPIKSKILRKQTTYNLDLS